MQLKSSHCLITTLLVIAMKRPIGSLNGKQFRKYVSNKKFITGAAGLVLAVLSIIAHLSFQPLLKCLIQSKMNLEKGSEFYKWWANPSVPTEVGIYFFHITNPYEVQNGGQVIKVKEMGKYMFKQHYERQIIGFSDNLETVSFYERRYYVFDPIKTTGSLDDNITVVNAPFAALGSIIPKVIDGLPFPPIFNSLPYRAVNSFLESHKQTLFVNTTIRDLLYGYKLDILDTAEGFANTLSPFGISSDIMPKQHFPNNSFGILNGRNGTLDGPFEVYTGLSSTQDMFGYFKSWKNQTRLDWWKSDSCNSINGTDGTIWPPFIDKSKRLYFYVPDVCRSLYVTFQEESEHKGIKTYIYSAPDNLMAGMDDNPENECFCMSEDVDQCRLNGIYDMSNCQNDIPLIISLPHFLGADHRITSRIDGLKPDPKIHRPVIHIEPTLGAVIHGDSRLQMSIKVPKNDYIRGFENLHSDLYVPLFWGYKKLGISDDFAAQLKSRLFTPIIVIKFLIIMGIITGFLLLFISFLLAFLCQTQVLSISLIDEMRPFQTVSELGDTLINNKIDSNQRSLELELLMKTSPETRI